MKQMDRNAKLVPTDTSPKRIIKSLWLTFTKAKMIYYTISSLGDERKLSLADNPLSLYLK